MINGIILSIILSQMYFLSLNKVYMKKSEQINQIKIKILIYTKMVTINVIGN